MRREQTEKALISLLSSLLILTSLTIQTQARSLLQACSPSSCGDIQNISYPFRLKNEPANCGDPDYELSCENNRAIMEFHSGRYYVKEISYRMRTIRLVDVNFANGTCNLPHNSLTSYEIENDIRYQGRTVYSFARFINCSTTTIIIDPIYRKLPCVGGNTSQVYVTADFYWQTLDSMPVGCSFLSGIPVDGINDYISYDAIVKLLESGFELGWSVDCRNCRLLNKTCVVSDESPLIYSCYRTGSELGELVECRNCRFLNKTCVVSAYKSPLNYSCHNSDNLVSTIAKIDFSQFPVVFALFLAISLIARFILAPIVVIMFLLHKFRKERKRVDNVETFLRNQQSLMPKRYSYTDIIAVTNHFKDKLGKGGFGSVYKGQLPGGILIAVKMLENTKFTAEEFINEVSTIGRIHHVNVVQLLGFCSEGSNRALVYEYMPNGSLDKHIFSNNGKAQSFSWEKLLEIALGTARGIEYLHSGCDVCILHFDIKPHNILLDRSFIPKVADFGLAKFFPKEKDFLSVSTMRGTIGYISPELISRHFGAVSSKSDVYSFGMLLLEMAGGRKNVDSKAKSSSKVYFPSWVYNHLVEGGGDLKLENVNEIDVETARKMCIVGLWCIQMKASDRPSMTKVVEMLEGSVEALKMPPRPFLCSPPRSPMKGPQLDASTSGQALESMEEPLLNGDDNSSILS